MGLHNETATVRLMGVEELEGLGLKALEAEAADWGAFEVILSTADKDRDGEEVKTAEWETPLPDHITFDNDHGMSVASTIGSGVPSIDEQGRLVVRGTFASTALAQTTRTLVAEKHIRTTSVAFRRKSAVIDGQRVVRRELLNGAFVAIPANPKAVVLSAKSLAADDDDEAEDGAVVKAIAGVVRKALLGSFEERQQAVQYALDRLYRRTSTYGYLVATTETVAVWRTWSYANEEEDRAEWRAEYSIDANGVATLEQPVRVRVVEVLTEVVSDDTGTRGASPGETKDTQVRGAHAPEPQDPSAQKDAAAPEQAEEQAQKRQREADVESAEIEQAKALLAAHDNELASLLTV